MSGSLLELGWGRWDERGRWVLCSLNYGCLGLDLSEVAAGRTTASPDPGVLQPDRHRRRADDGGAAACRLGHLGINLVFSQRS